MTLRYVSTATVTTFLLVAATACGGSSSSPSAASAPTGTSSSPPTAVVSPSPATKAPALDPALQRLALTAADVSSRHVKVTRQLEDDGTSITGAPTLDECNGQFPSESARRARAQFDYLVGGSVFDASNEVVRYTPAGAAQSYTELRSAFRDCPKQFAVGSGAVQIDTSVMPRNPRFTPHQLTEVDRVKQAGGNSEWTAAVFQYHGSLFDAVYADGGTRAGALALADRLGLLIASQLHHAA